MKKVSITPILLLFTIGLAAQANYTVTNKSSKNGSVLTSCEGLETFAATITQSELAFYVNTLASAEFEGRETGTEGQRKAADFIAEQFEKMGLPKIGDENSYFQNIVFTSEKWAFDKIQLNAGGVKFQHMRDFYAVPALNNHRISISASEVTFLGYGIEEAGYNDYSGKNLSGKTILILSGEPSNTEGVSWLTKTKVPSEWSKDILKKLQAAYKHGVQTVLIIDSDYSRSLSRNRNKLVDPDMVMGCGELAENKYANHFILSLSTTKQILGKYMSKLSIAENDMAKKGKPVDFTFPTQLDMIQEKSIWQLRGSNVLGFVQGIDSTLAKEVVVVSAHYDHLGKRGNRIYFGADDNASGTGAVIEIAEAFAEAKKQGEGPRRSVLFLLVSGEEKGLLGSQYYTSFPTFPLENTVANLNIDMIGRTDWKYRNNPNYIYVIGADRLSTTLHDINEAANEEFTKLTLDYTFNDKDDPQRFYYRSDHYNFAKNGIPSVFYFNGTHEDYHQSSDTADKINFDKIAQISKLIFYTTWEIANRDERLKVNVSGD